jgi:CRP-like cAMP-binding protein
MDMMHHVEGVLRDPAADVFTLDYGEFATTYELRFWIQDFDRRTRIESDVLRGAWYHLKRNHIRIAYPSRDLYVRRETQDRRPAEILEWLKKVDMFEPLEETDLLLLADDIRSQLFAKGEIVCRQGEVGGTFYLIKSGLMSIHARSSEGVEAEVARLHPGEYFGEMSILTGEMRNSTCTVLEDAELLCLDRESFSVLLNENPPIAKKISEVIALRTQETQSKLAQGIRPQGSQADEVATRRILEKIWNIFGFRQ